MEDKTKLNLDYVMVGLLLVLLIFAGAQAVQIDNLQSKVISGGVAGRTVEAKVTTSSAPVSRPSSAMVGGC